MSISALRTPDDRFRNLPDFPYRPHFVDDLVGCESLRMHYVDEGPRDAGATFLCLHGEPTWTPNRFRNWPLPKAPAPGLPRISTGRFFFLEDFWPI